MIHPFESIRKEDIASVGGKGANLGELTAAGIAVPPGFVISAAAYRCFLAENGLDGYVSEALRAAGSDREKLLDAAKAFRAKILAGRLPDKVTAAVTEACHKLARQAGTETLRTAVRSSATAEDLPDASFAGQQETYLNVIGPAAVLRQVLCCYASLWGDRAVLYRQAQGYDQAGVALAVVVQQMVESETAGVLFTADPVTRDTERIQINASYGLGESVVSGRVTPDSYLCTKDGRLLQASIGPKQTEILYAAAGTKEVPVSPARQAARALCDADIQALCAQAVRIERHYGRPMDIEWAIRGGNVYILQARPITTLAPAAPDPAEEAQIARYLQGCKTSGALRKNLAFLLEKMPDAFYPFDSDMTAVINNQKAFIFAQVGLEISMQPQVDDDGIETLPPNGKKLNRNIFKLGRAVRQITDFESCRAILERQLGGFAAELDGIRALPVETLDLAGCGLAIADIYDFVRRLAYARFYYSLFPSFFGARKYERAAKRIDPAYTSYDFLQDLDNRTARSAQAVAALAQTIRSQPALAQAITGGMDYRTVCARFPEITPAFDVFLEQFGYTTDYNCYCLHARSLWEAPDRLLCILRPLLTAEPKAEPAGKYARLMEQLRATYPPKQYAKLERNIGHLRYFHVAREESQYMWETAFYFMKQVLARAALLSTGDADYFHSLAYLFKDEVLALCARGSLNEADRERIGRRQRSRPLAEKVWERAKLLVFSDGGDVLKGVSGSAGEAVGRACIVSGPEEFYKLQKGDVLVCRLTDPEWTPLFTLASAVVADTGAALSHAAIVAREYGIPAVMGVGLATAKFRDGDLIRVDGTKGEAAKVG